nr:unnamed protein product [Callosobruchus chinensis]
MTRLEEQKRTVSQALENQDQRISAIETQLVISQKHAEEQLQEMAREELRELTAGEGNLAAVVPALLDRQSGVVVKPYPYNGKTSLGVYYLQFENIARMSNWSSEEKACVLTSMLSDSAAAILENLSSSNLRDYSRITSALKLRFGDAHLTAIAWSTAQPHTAS